MSLLPILIIFSVVSLAGAEEHPHGLPNGTQPAISPDEYRFFHPNYSYPPKPTCNSYKCSPPTGTLPLAATVKSTPAQESSTTENGGGLGAGCVVGVSLSLLFICMVAMGAYFVIIRRRANSDKANPKLDLV